MALAALVVPFVPGAGYAQAAASATLAELLLERLPGEYDNHEQRWQAGEDGAPLPDRRHQRLVPVTAPGLGATVLALDEWPGDEPGPTLRRLLLRLDPASDDSSLVVTVWAAPAAGLPDSSLEPARFARLRERDLQALARCELRFRRADSGELLGRAEPDGCRNARRRNLAAPVPRYWRHDGETLVLADTVPDADAEQRAGTVPGALRLRRAQHYTGWAAVKPDGPASTGGDETYRFMPGLTVHNEGQIVAIRDPAGKPTGYSFQLARLTYQNTRTPILKLGLIDDATGRTLAYSWAEPGAGRIGINLRWAQVGLTRKAGRPSFAVEPILQVYSMSSRMLPSGSRP